MNLGRLRSRAHREWVVLLLLPALAFRLLLPAGTMQMCHGDPLSAAAVRLIGTGEAPDGPGARHDAPCIFAATAATAPPTLALHASSSPSSPVLAPATVQPSPVLRCPHRPQSPRAPPSTV
jgi:hypothetical protein